MPDFSDSYPSIPSAPLHFAYDFGVQAAIVAVNEETGTVRLLKLIAAHDVGAPILRRNVIGQIEGAVVQGIGYALSEQFIVENGIPKTVDFKDLKLLRLRDIPVIVPIIIEDPHPKGPFGAKGMGELAISPTAPAIANAVYDATGLWVTSLPITKEKLGLKLRK
jgi:CO/xanthine dehydrogenase Mo-binding subunit